MSKLNMQQLEAVNCTEGAVLVSAGAGTGKTRVLTYRVAYLINDCGILPHNILAITFTNKATSEMKERIMSMCRGGSNVWVSTFHSLCAKILREHIYLFGGNYNRHFTIYDDNDRQKVVKKIIKSQFENFAEAGELEKKALNAISKAKNDGIFPGEFALAYPYVRFVSEIEQIYYNYEKEKAHSNSLDFDDLILKTIELFKAQPHILGHYQNLFKYIHVDEFQDTNKTQYNLIKMLAAKHKNVLVVGDEDQSIYAFRGANYKNLNDFKNDFAPVKVFKLECNYRSTKSILTAANMLINQNEQRSESKNLFTQNPQGNEVVYKPCENDYKEADFVAGEVLRAYHNGTPLKEIAVIFRINALSRQIENAFVENGIAYRLVGGLKFYERAEIKNLLAYLRLLVNPHDNEALSRIINFPKRGVGAVALQKLEAYAAQKGISCLAATADFSHAGVKDFAQFFNEFKTQTKNTGLNETAQTLVRMLHPVKIYNAGTEEDENRLLNIKSFLIGVNEFCENNEEAGLTEFLENVNLDSLASQNDSTEVVTLSTVHGVKGLEFDIVFLTGCEDGMMPYRLSIEEGNVEEERRLAYVAITRARKQLFITRALSRFSYGGGYSSATIKSRFLDEMGLGSADEWHTDTAERGIYNRSGQDQSRQFIADYSSNSTLLPNNKARIEDIKKASDLIKERQTAENKFYAGAVVNHARFGSGVVKTVTGRNVIVVFDDGKEKELNIDFAPLTLRED